ncbi:hypothetical protein FB451DRAFT_1257931 [Mycena latifolia]|nr:hypothetical protein FB451DRAFT_1257931 [Mycena latifolia]
MDYVVEFDTYWNVMLGQLAWAIIAVVLYALYVVLVAFSIYTIAHRNPAGRRFLLVTASAMFLLGTLNAVLSVLAAGIAIQVTKELIQGSADLLRLVRLYETLNLTVDILVVANNFVADLVFLYRCYVIWESKKMVLILPGLSMFATLVAGFISSFGVDSPTLVKIPFIDIRIPYIMGATTNVVLMCLTAGRIWYKRHEAHIINGTTFRKKYDTAIAMILESGAIYCFIGILAVISLSLGNDSSNIVPTLILVRVGLAHFQWKQDTTSILVPTPSKMPSMRRHLVLPSTDPSGTVIHIKQEDSLH